MATRKEAMRIAEELIPQGFSFNSLELHEESGKWIATYLDDSDPPRVVIERWQDFYTENDPEPETETEASEDEASPMPNNGAPEQSGTTSTNA